MRISILKRIKAAKVYFNVSKLHEEKFVLLPTVQRVYADAPDLRYMTACGKVPKW